MKRIFSLSMVMWLVGTSALRAQNSASAAADQQAAEERYQRLAGKLQDLTEAQDSQRKRIDDLQNQIRELREQTSKPDADKVQRDELRKLAEQVKEIDEKRAADKELIVKEISKLANMPAGGKSPKPAPKPQKIEAAASGETPTDAASGQNYEGYEHSVKSGETLIAIVRAYNKEYGLKLTVDQLLKHPMNSNVKPEKLAVGQKIFIPAK